MRRHYKQTVIAIFVSFAVNIALFINSATRASYEASAFDRILNFLATPAERFTD
jgi:hypothetical protein